MKTAIEKPVTPGGVFDHLMVPHEAFCQVLFAIY